MKIINSIFAIAILLSVCSCGNQSGTDSGSSTTTTATTVTNDNKDQPKVIKKLVTSADGLLMRDKPDISGKTITVMPFNSKIVILEENIKKDNILKVSGYWVKVRFGNYEGYCFDGFLK
jgi:hypothetical protein